MKCKTFIAVFLGLFNIVTVFGKEPAPSITIQFISANNSIPDTLHIQYQHLEIRSYDDLRNVKIARKDLPWRLSGESAVYVYIQELNMKVAWLCEPGDHVVIHETSAGIEFAGRGAEKLRLQHAILIASNAVKKPSTPDYFTPSVEDYLVWHAWLQQKWERVEPLLEKYKDSISARAWQYIKADFIDGLEDDRRLKFAGVKRMISKKIGVTKKMVCTIYDSTFFTPQAVWMRSQPVGLAGEYRFVSDQVFRKFNFSPDSTKFLDDEPWRRQLYYEQAKKEYKGLALEKFLAYLMTVEVIKELGFTHEADLLLQKYYSEKRDPHYVAYVKAFQRKAGALRVGAFGPEFKLADAAGTMHTRKDYKDKIVLINFIDGGAGSRKMQHALEKIHAALKNDTNMVVLTISAGADDNKQMQRSRVHLTTGEKGKEHITLKAYGVYDFPKLHLVDHIGKVLANPVPDPVTNKEELVQLLTHQLTVLKNDRWALLNDGPYVLEEGDGLKAVYVSGDKVKTQNWQRSATTKFTVHADSFNTYFTVQLKPALKTEPSLYERPDRLLALSDIEGNFDVFRKLLQSNKIIDKDYNWIFGKGHLVIAGDVFDRGDQALECLWLIYSLEEKAKAAGGYVHFILGNHEIMNLSGNLRYVHKKYKENAVKIGKPYTDLFDNNSELGRWLRTKNIVEQIGELLFAHAGFSPEINDLQLSIPAMNELVRPYLDKDTVARKSPDKALSLLYNTTLSPFWYRQYYMDHQVTYKIRGNRLDTLYKTSVGIVDTTLSRYKAKHIITGHTIDKNNKNYGQYVSVHFDGKVINTDTRHARGNSEALLIEGDHFYRVDAAGKRVLLFVQ